MLDIHIEKTGSYIPKTVVTNDDLSKIMDTSDEWIFPRTGIKERTISKEKDVFEMALAAVENMNLTPEEIKSVDLIVVATMSYENATPGVAQLLQAAIGCKNEMQCFDINVACSGFVYGLDITNNFMRSGAIKNAIVVGVDKMTNVVDPLDRGTAILFADAAGCAFLSASEETTIEHRYFNTSGSKEALFCKDKLYMNGPEVFKFATSAVGNCLNMIDKEIGIENVDYLLLHQANQRITNNVIKRYKLDESKVICNIEKIGNTSSASVGLLLDEVFPKLKKGDKVAMIGFGSGLAYGSIVYTH